MELKEIGRLRLRLSTYWSARIRIIELSEMCLTACMANSYRQVAPSRRTTETCILYFLIAPATHALRGGA